jgi:exosortase family protein XrtF
MNWKEFKPTIFFLGKFLGIYLVANLAYGWFVTSFEPAADPITAMVTRHSCSAVSLLGWPSSTIAYPSKKTVGIVYENKSIVNVYEGCNSINVMIIFAAFLFSFGPVNKRFWWFLPMGLIIIYGMNLARIGLLFLVSLNMPHYLYFTHKYLFTAFIYGIVFLLWIWWVSQKNRT